MLKKILEELILIRKELQTIRRRLELDIDLTVGGKPIYHQEDHDCWR